MFLYFPLLVVGRQGSQEASKDSLALLAKSEMPFEDLGEWLFGYG